MNILAALKMKFNDAMKKEGVELSKRKQFNVKIDEDLVFLLRFFATEYQVPRFVVSEHVIQTGLFYLKQATEDEEKREILKNHLVNNHLLSNVPHDDEAILRIGEQKLDWQLLDLAEHVIQNYRLFRRVLRVARRTRDMAYVEQHKDALLISALEFASWIKEHRHDKRAEVRVNAEEEGKENGETEPEDK